MHLTGSTVYDVQMLLACNPAISDSVANVLLNAERTDAQVGAEQNLDIRLDPPTSLEDALARAAEARQENLRAKYNPQWSTEAIMYESRRRIYNGWARKFEDEAAQPTA